MPTLLLLPFSLKRDTRKFQFAKGVDDSKSKPLKAKLGPMSGHLNGHSNTYTENKYACKTHACTYRDKVIAIAV